MGDWLGMVDTWLVVLPVTELAAITAEHGDGAQPARRGLLGDPTGVGAGRRKKPWAARVSCRAYPLAGTPSDSRRITCRSRGDLDHALDIAARDACRAVAM